MRLGGLLLCAVVLLVATSARSEQHGDVLVPEGEPEQQLGALEWPSLKHKGSLESLAFSPDGRMLAVSGGASRVRLWEVGSGREARRVEGYAWVAFSPAGGMWVSGRTSETAGLWEVRGGGPVRRLGELGLILSSALSPDGRTVALGVADGTVRLWEMATGREVRSLRGHEGGVVSLAFSPEGRTLMSAGRDGTVRQWDVSSGSELRRWELQRKDTVGSPVFSPDGRLLASGGEDGTVRLWAAASGGEVRHWDAHKGSVGVLAFSPDGRLLASGGADGTLRLWGVEEGREVRRWGVEDTAVLGLKAGPVEALAFSPDGRLLASGSRDGPVRLWDVASGGEVRRLEEHQCMTWALALGPDGRTMAWAGVDGSLWLWDLERGGSVRRWSVQTELVSVTFSPDGQRLALGGGDGTVRLWDVGSGREVRLLKGHEGPILSVAFSPDGQMLASGGRDKTVRLWAVRDGGEVHRLEGGHTDVVRSVVFSPDGRTVASGGDTTVWLWNVDSGDRVRSWDAKRQSSIRLGDEITDVVMSVAFSPDGRLLAAAGDEGAQAWDVDGGRQVWWRKDDAHESWSIAFSPDGRTLASAGMDNTVWLWEAGSGQAVRRLEGHAGPVSSVAFTPDGQRLVSGGLFGEARLWSLAQGRSLGEWHGDGRLGWLSQRLDQGLFRSDDGRFLQHPREDGTLEPVVPPRSEVAPRLSAEASLGLVPGDFGEAGELTLRVSNAPDAGRAYWIRAEPVELPPGLVLLRPSTVVRLEPGGTTELRLGLSYLRPEGVPLERNARVRLALVHAHGEGPTVEVPLRLRAPEIELVGEPRVDGENLTVTLENTGDQASGALLLSGMFRAEGSKEQGGPQQKLDDLPPGVRRTLALAIPPELREAGTFSFALTTRFERWPRTSTRTFENVRVTPPSAAYGALMAGALLMGAAVYYARVYRNPVVVQTTASPSALRGYSLSEMRTADLALQRARRRDSTVIAAGIPLIRWERVLRGAGTATEAAESFAEAVGGRLGAATASDAWGLSLPPLRLRFAQETAVVVVDGPRLESGEAERRMADVFQDGKGPGQVLVLDRTVAQNAVQVLRHVPRVRSVVLTAERLRDLLLAEEPVRVLESTITEQVAVSELSPYQVAGAVKNESFFFGRERELRDIVDRSFRNFLLVGQRQMGKSSLLMAVKRRLEARAGLDVHYVELADADLHRHLARHRKLVPADDTALPRFEEVAAGEPSRPRVWLIDEVDDFVSADARAGYPLVRVMRALAEEGRAYFILAGFWDLYRAVVLDEKQPLRNFGEHRRLEPLDARAALALVTEPMTALGLAWDAPSTTDSLLARTGRRANLLVLACKGLVETLPHDTRTLTREHLERVFLTDRDLRDQCRRWRGDSPLHRAVVRQALLLGHPTREEVRLALAARGADISASDFDEAMDHRELSYVLVPDADGRLSCPVPLMRGYIESERGLEQGLSEDLEDLRRGLIAVPPPAA